MSAFNTLVPFGIQQILVIRIIDWDIEVGRVRYAWLSEDGKQAYILFKDGPTSWSENKEEIEQRIRSHPYFASYDVVERDTAYVIGTFDLTKDYDVLTDFTKELVTEEKALLPPGGISITEKPFDIFDRNLKAMEDGTLPAELQKGVDELAEKIKKGLEGGEQIIIV